MAPIESSPESMRGASAEIVVPVTSAAMAVSSSRRAFCERAPALAAAGALCFGLLCGLLGVDYVILLEFRGFDDPTVTRSSSRKRVLDES